MYLQQMLLMSVNDSHERRTRKEDLVMISHCYCSVETICANSEIVYFKNN